MSSTQSQTSNTMYVGNPLQTDSQRQSSLSAGERESSTLPQSPKTGSSQTSTRVGSPSSGVGNSSGQQTESAEQTTTRSVTATTLNWLLVQIQSLELGEVGMSEGADYYEIRLPTAKWAHENGSFYLVPNVPNTESGQ
jgi:hypothetical protein